MSHDQRFNVQVRRRESVSQSERQTDSGCTVHVHDRIHRTTTSWHVVHGINLFIMMSRVGLSDEEKVINHTWSLREYNLMWKKNSILYVIIWHYTICFKIFKPKTDSWLHWWLLNFRFDYVGLFIIKKYIIGYIFLFFVFRLNWTHRLLLCLGSTSRPWV